MTAEHRYRLVAFVCAGGVVRETGDLGYSTFAEIFRRNAFAHGCQFAVVEHGCKYRAFDMHTVTFTPELVPVEGISIDYPNLDAAIAGCVLTHT